MKKIFLFLCFLTLVVFHSNSYSLSKDTFKSFDRESSGKDIPTFAIVQELNKKYREDPNLNTDQKIKFIIEALSFAAPYLPDQDFENLIKSLVCAREIWLDLFLFCFENKRIKI